jgi:hypothetical protein
MSKWASFATGMGEGYLAGKRYKDTKKERDEDRQMMKDILMSRAEKTATDPVVAGPSASVASSMVESDPLGIRSMYDPEAKANGGMVGEMPKHHDKMSWQRGSFKK